MIPYLDFKPLAEFVDRVGTTRPIPGCTPLGRMEFWERVEQIQHLMTQADPSQNWQEFYHASSEFRHQVNRCLELNGISPEWLTFAHLEAFLFHRHDPERDEVCPGWLIELNTPPKAEGQKGDGDALSAEELVAAIALTVGNTKEALELCTQLRPADFALGIVQAQAELKDDKLREQKKRKKAIGKLKKKFTPDQIKQLIEMPVEQLQGAAIGGSA